MAATCRPEGAYGRTREHKTHFSKPGTGPIDMLKKLIKLQKNAKSNICSLLEHMVMEIN